MQDRRLGNFRISLKVIEQEPKLARAILKDVIVLRAECLWHMGYIDYVGTHPQFDVVLEYLHAPNYTFNLTVVRTASDLVNKIEWVKESDVPSHRDI